MVEAEERSLPRSLQKKSSSRKKAPPNPTPPHLPADDESSHHDEELDRSPSPVSSIAGDDKGPGEGPA